MENTGPESLVAVGLRSIDAVSDEVQRRHTIQGFLVQRITMTSQPSVTAAEQLTMTGEMEEMGGGVKKRCEVSQGLLGRREGAGRNIVT